ncbi:MAG: hypothetical protein JSW34_07120 [Candidatus Zixiibacteriota bacterium]|nr:MAG: hypothetical protein JSW34_07120 [candidate division Zixibacteria bacterium]
MTPERSRTRQQIFADMHRQLRRWNPSVPESVDRLDPVLKILMELYAHQLERIDRRIDRTWTVAVNSLVRSLAPESRRWPVPAHTIMKCKPVDPVVEVDPHTRFFYKEKREGGKTFFFSSQRREKIIAATAKFYFVRFGDAVINVSPGVAFEQAEGDLADARLRGQGPGEVYIGVEYGGLPTGLKDAKLFLQGPETVRRQLRWGYWYPGSNSGGFYDDVGFCPGATTSLEDMFTDADEPVNWGGLRTTADLFRHLENNFVVLPERFTATWELGPIEPRLLNLIDEEEVRYTVEQENLYWIKVELPPGGDKVQFKKGFQLHFDCFVATNKNGLSTYKYTGGNRLVEVEVPEPLDSILEIEQVIDSGKNEYQPVYRVQESPTQQVYSLEERNGKLVLWFDYSSQLDPPPDYITVFYSVTCGIEANGIAAGEVNELYEKHPGLDAVDNVTAVQGAVPARTEAQIITEVSQRLRNRDRVLSFDEIASWATTFDPRIKEASCENSVQRAARGVRRCLLVKVRVGAEDFYSDDETALLRERLRRFLKSRAPVNTAFEVEIVKR